VAKARGRGGVVLRRGRRRYSVSDVDTNARDDKKIKYESTGGHGRRSNVRASTQFGWPRSVFTFPFKMTVPSAFAHRAKSYYKPKKTRFNYMWHAQRDICIASSAIGRGGASSGVHPQHR